MTRRTRRFVIMPPRGSNPEVPAVASLGVRARLILSPTERKRELAELIAAHARLQRDWEDLFQRLITLLEGAGRRPD
jgi:hypothetical protein